MRRITTRRQILTKAVPATVAGLLVKRAAAALPGEAEPAANDRALLIAMIKQGRTVPKRDRAYRLDAPVELEAGSQLLIEPGVRIDYVADHPPGQVHGVFIVTGDDVIIRVLHGGEAIVSSRQTDAFCYAVISFGRRDLEVSGIVGSECALLFAGAAGGQAASYSTIRTSGEKIDLGGGIRVIGGGATFERPQKQGHGACLISYTDGFEVSGCRFKNVSHGVQWWGGDSNVAVDGARTNERKCRNGVIRNVSVDVAEGGSIWGSMGENILVESCRAADTGDVGFDAEGSNHVIFRNCVQTNANNGCFAVFYLNTDIRFENCRGIQDKPSAPLFRLYNSTQTPENGDIVIEGGRFECRNGVGIFDTASGPAGKIAVRNAAFVNVRLEVIANNHHNIEITGNRLSFTAPSATRFNAVSAGGTNSWNAKAGSVLIARNIILNDAQTIDGSAGIYITQADYNGSPTSVVTRNTISGFPIDVRCIWAGANPNTHAEFHVRDNSGTSGAVVITDNTAKSPAKQLVSGNVRRSAGS